MLFSRYFLQFLDKHNIGGVNLDCGGVPILAIKNYSPPEILSIDDTTMTALQIFSLTWQTSGASSGRYNQRREGLSLYRSGLRSKQSLSEIMFLHKFREIIFNYLELISRIFFFFANFQDLYMST